MMKQDDEKSDAQASVLVYVDFGFLYLLDHFKQVDPRVLCLRQDNGVVSV